MGQQQQFGLRIGLERGLISREHIGLGRGLRDVELRDLDAAPALQPVHRVLHRIIVEIGIEHTVAGLQLVVAGNQGLQRFGSTTR